MRKISSVQFSSVAQSCPTLCDPMNCSTPGLPVHHQLPEFTQTHVHRVANHLEQIGGGKLLYMIAHFATTNSSSLCGCVQEKLVESQHLAIVIPKSKISNYHYQIGFEFENMREFMFGKTSPPPAIYEDLCYKSNYNINWTLNIQMFLQVRMD